MYNFQWDFSGNKIEYCNKKPIDQIMDNEDYSVIYDECKILNMIDVFIDENELDDESINKILELKDVIQEKIESDVLQYAILELV